MSSQQRQFPAAAGAATKHIRQATTGSLASGEQALNLPFKPEYAKKGAAASTKARRLPPPSRVGLPLAEPYAPGTGVRLTTFVGRSEKGAEANRKEWQKRRRLPPPSQVGMVDFARNLAPRSPEEAVARKKAQRAGQARGGRTSRRLKLGPPPSSVGL